MRKLKPEIYRTIENLLKEKILTISAKMVVHNCQLVNSTIPWHTRIPAICNSMRKFANDFGGQIVGKNQDYGDFTIMFSNNKKDGDIFHISSPNGTPPPNLPKLNNRLLKYDQSVFIDDLIDVLHVFSPTGRKRIYSDLTKVDSQILCKGLLNGKSAKGVTLFGKPNCNLIEKQILERYSSTVFIDVDINWKFTRGKKFNLNITKKAVSVIINYLSLLKKNGKYDEFIDLFLTQLKGNNFSLIRLLSQPKYKSKEPGNRLVGKQTTTSNTTNKGFVLEHTIPAAYLKAKLLKIIDSNSVDKELDNVMSKLFTVWLNTDDDLKLKTFGLNSKMPDGWNWEDDPLQRYWKADIEKNSIVAL